MGIIIVADTSCLIIYEKIGRLDVLRDLYHDLVVTREVAIEFGSLPDWVRIQEPRFLDTTMRLYAELGKGEASSIALALELTGSLLIIDEKKGRKVAEELNIPIIGSLGILLKAKEEGLIVSVREVLDSISKTDFRIGDSIRKRLIEVAGE